tara:strand:+ start:265 stop:486 length:222 start_codon:yes stop_codon:yes gene_type:complete
MKNADWTKNIDGLFLNTAGALEVKAIMLGRLAVNGTVTLEEVTKEMWNHCDPDDMALCERRAKAFMNLYCGGF